MKAMPSHSKPDVKMLQMVLQGCIGTTVNQVNTCCSCWQLQVNKRTNLKGGTLSVVKRVAVENYNYICQNLRNFFELVILTLSYKIFDSELLQERYNLDIVFIRLKFLI